MKKILLLAAAGLIFQVTPVLAEHHEGDGGHDRKNQMFEKHDTNGDGMISEAEFLEHAKKKFGEKDSNGDGSISKDEAKAAHDAKREKRKEMRDQWKEKRQDRMEKGSSELPE